MKIDFQNIPETVTPNFKGGEGTFISRAVQEGPAKIMYDKLTPDSSIGLHKHEGNGEIIYILEGSARCIYDDGEEHLSAGDCHYCPDGHTHSLINDGTEDLVFFAVVQ